MKKVIVLSAAFFLLLCSNRGYATPVQWTATSGGNNHWYDYVVTGVQTWEAAKADAERSGGYLATLTSVEENRFVWNELRAQHDINLFKLGGYQTSPTVEPVGSWAWVTGEPWTFNTVGAYPWDSMDPNNNSGNQNWLAFSDKNSGTWFDIEFSRWNSCGYIIEYNTAAVPEPTTLLLLGSGLLGLAGIGRKRLLRG